MARLTDTHTQYRQTVNSLVQTFSENSLELSVGAERKLCHLCSAGGVRTVFVQIPWCRDGHLPVLPRTRRRCVQKSTAAPPPAEETQDILTLYKSLIESTLTFNISSGHDHLYTDMIFFSCTGRFTDRLFFFVCHDCAGHWVGGRNDLKSVPLNNCVNV